MHGPPIIPDESEKRLWQSVEELEILNNWRESVLAYADIGVFDWPMDSETLYISPTNKRMLGYEESEIADTYAGWLGLIEADRQSEVEKKIQDALDSDSSSYNTLHRMQHKGGSTVWVLFRSRILRNPDGKACRMLGAAIEISDLRQQLADAFPAG